MNEGKKFEVYNNILLDLKKMNGVKMIGLASRDGYLIGEHINEREEMLMHMSATMLRAAETITNKLENVNPDRVIVDYECGKLIAVTAGTKALISVMTKHDTSLDSIIREIEKTASRIQEIL